MQLSLFYNSKNCLQPFGRDGPGKPWEVKGDTLNETMNAFVEQPLALPGSAKKPLPQVDPIRRRKPKASVAVCTF